MLREVLCLAIGFGIIVAVTVDIVWTTLGTHGGGPISMPVMSLVWKGALELHHRRPHHRLLSFAGSFILALLLVFWIALLWTGWVFVYSAKDDGLVEARNHKATTIAARSYFVGTMLSTSGTNEILPNGRRWRLLAAINSITGIGTVTLSLTFLLQVLSAVVQKRTFGAWLSDIGGTPARVVARAWSGENFDSLGDQLIQATGMLHVFTEQHLAYPVLHYFHSERERTAATLRVAALHELTLLIADGAAPQVRLPPMVLDTLRAALEGYAEMLAEEGVKPADEPPPPSLSVLRDRGVPAVDDEAFRRAVQSAQKTRRFFAGLLHDDGWRWEQVNGER